MPYQDIPNELACPIPIERLAALMRASGAIDLSDLAPHRQAQLALFCYGRTHLRSLAFKVAAKCGEAALVARAGHAGAALYHQAFGEPEVEMVVRPGRKITLARWA